MKRKYKKNVVAIVCARGGSKGIPLKNIKKLSNKPLIFWCLKTLSKVKEINRLIVSTDDIKIKKNVLKYFPKVEILDRPSILADDKATLTEVTKYVSNQIKTTTYHPDYVLQIAPTCPFISAITVKKIIKNLLLRKTNCVVTLKRIEHEHPYRAKIFNKRTQVFNQFIKGVNVEKFMSRQDLPTLYCTSGAIYGRSFDLLQTFNPKKKSFVLGNKPIGVIVNDIEAINIDRPIDFEFAQFIKNKKSELF